MLKYSLHRIPHTLTPPFSTDMCMIFRSHQPTGLILSIIKHHDDIIKLKHFPLYWPFVRGIHRSLMNSPKKGQWWRGALVFYLIGAWLNGRVNNPESGDLRRHRAHYDVTVMIAFQAYTFYRSSSSPYICNASLWTSKCWCSTYWPNQDEGRM